MDSGLVDILKKLSAEQNKSFERVFVDVVAMEYERFKADVYSCKDGGVFDYPRRSFFYSAIGATRALYKSGQADKIDLLVYQ